jgi:acyl-CoA synthetase (AMP-forming)/AMP-acid ligase II
MSATINERAPILTNVADYPEWYASHTPDAEALVFEDTRLSYREFGAAVDRYARAMIAAGVSRGDRVATLTPPSHEYLISFLAAARIGAIWLGLNAKYKREELAYVLRDSEPCLLLAQLQIAGRDLTDDVRALWQATPSLKTVVTFDESGLERGMPLAHFLVAGESVSDETLRRVRSEVLGTDPCLVVYTSGSTGPSKGALLAHAGIIHFCHHENRVWYSDRPSRVNYLPINHAGCVVDMSLPVVVAGGKLVLCQNFDARETLAIMQRERITQWFSVPSAFIMQIEQPDFAAFDLSSVDMIAWGGASMPIPAIERLGRICPRMATNYGLTEALVATMVDPTDDADTLVRTVGKAFPGVEIRIVDAQGRDQPPGTPGELWCRSIQNMVGYWRRPEATAETITEDGWLKTGDLLVHNADGSYSMIGRIKEMYKSGGYNVYPREIEEAISSHPGVAMSAVVPVSDPRWQEVGVAYVLKHDGYSLDTAEILEHCKSRLANYKIPKEVVITTSLPLLPIGKIDKMALRKRAKLDFVRS